jgi:VRR-NUC domain
MAQLTSALISPTEREFTAQVMTIAHLYGWTVAHFRPARRADGSWMTPLQGDGAGFPDLVLVRGERCLFAELKAEGGRLAPLQQRWLEALRAVPGLEVVVWKPSQLAGEILAALT